MPNFVKSIFLLKIPADRLFSAKDDLRVFVPDFPEKRHTFSVQCLPGAGLKCPYFFSKWVRLPSKPDLGMGFATFSDAFTFVLLIVILVFKPTGLFGEKTTDKV